MKNVPLEILMNEATGAFMPPEVAFEILPIVEVESPEWFAMRAEGVKFARAADIG